MRVGRSPGTRTHCKVRDGDLADLRKLIPSVLGSGSCSLGYRLVEIPKTLRDDYTDTPASYFDRRCPVPLTVRRLTDRITADKLLSTIFSILWTSLLAYIAYSFIRHATLPREWGSSRRIQAGNCGTGHHPWGPGSGGRDNRRRSPSPPQSTNLRLPDLKDKAEAQGLDRCGSRRCRFVSLQQSHTTPSATSISDL